MTGEGPVRHLVALLVLASFSPEFRTDLRFTAVLPFSWSLYNSPTYSGSADIPKDRASKDLFRSPTRRRDLSVVPYSLALLRRSSEDTVGLHRWNDYAVVLA